MNWKRLLCSIIMVLFLVELIDTDPATPFVRVFDSHSRTSFVSPPVAMLRADAVPANKRLYHGPVVCHAATPVFMVVHVAPRSFLVQAIALENEGVPKHSRHVVYRPPTLS